MARTPGKRKSLRRDVRDGRSSGSIGGEHATLRRHEREERAHEPERGSPALGAWSFVLVLGVWSMGSVMTACSAPEKDAPLGTVALAATGTVQTTACADPAYCNNAQCTTEINSPGASLSEPFAFATKSGATWEMITSVNGTTNSFLQYGCTRNNYGSWKTFQTSAIGGGSPGTAGDTTGVYASAAGKTWIATLRNFAPGQNTLGIQTYSTAEPCPASGEPNWSQTDWTFMIQNKVGADHPTIVYDSVYDKKYVVWGNSIATGGANIMVLMINADGSWHAWQEANSACSGCTSPSCTCNICANFPPPPGGVGVPNAAIDSLGNVHVVYDDGQSHIVHEWFADNGGGFSCLNNVVGPVNGAQPFCAACSTVGTFAQLGPQGSKCIRANSSPSIAIDHQPGPNADEIVVAYNSYSAGADCPSGGFSNETRVYTNGYWGLASWVSRLRSCPYTWAFPRVTASSFAGAPAGTPGLFHLHVLAIATPVNGSVIPYECKTTDGGVTWPTCTILVPAPFMPYPIGTTSCYAGDYQGAAADPAHSRFFYDWGQPLYVNNGAGVYAIKGQTNDP